VRYFSEQQVCGLAAVDEVVREIKAAFARNFSATLHMPTRTSLPLAGSAVLLIMPCYESALNAAGVKIVTVSDNAGVNASYELLDPRTGLGLARMEANYLTDLRTAATSAVATDLLARQDAETLGVFGTGRQAAAHLRVLPHVRSFRRLLVCGSERSDVNAFCAKMKSEMAEERGSEIQAVDAETCARESDVLCTCTTSSTPLLNGQWLRAGSHLNLVGAFQPHTREVDDETVKRARVFVDTYEGALAEAGDLLIPLGNGSIAREHILGDLHELASGKKPARTNRNDITLFKSVGCALEDLVTARLIYERAQSQN
jgi:ornithine cyclodeaminase/alanine dehydrogenase-like protein (mu-crystallin family)